jgi:hypothetical protein
MSAEEKIRHAIGVEAFKNKRGGLCFRATCACGWRGPQRGTERVAVIDTRAHQSVVARGKGACNVR